MHTEAQTYMNNMLADSINTNTQLKSERFRSMWNGKIKGDRYVNDSFTRGKINQEAYLLRYDLYEDRFEFKKQINAPEDYVIRDLSVVVHYDTVDYYFLPYYYRSKKKFNVGYLSLIHDLDTAKNYRKNEVTFRPATFSPTTIEIGFPPRFIKRVLYFIQKGEETPVQISKKQLKKLNLSAILLD
jgi:hypothetical protein